MRQFFLSVISALIIYHPAWALSEREPATVLSVTDGDTLKVNLHGKRERVRLIGIDTPEIEGNERAIREVQRTGEDLKTVIRLGERAAEYTKSIVKAGAPVQLEFDVEYRDRYGRLLAYVYLADGRMVNEEILRAGFGKPLTVPPNVRYSKNLTNAFRDAESHHRGLFSR